MKPFNRIKFLWLTTVWICAATLKLSAQDTNTDTEKTNIFQPGPINFYGKVVDENCNPIEGAAIQFQWLEEPTLSGWHHPAVLSDAKGLFSLTGQRGIALCVLVSKKGYYTSRRDDYSSNYSPWRGKISHADPLSPVIFHLRKRGVGANLITSQYTARPSFIIRIPRNGTPIKVDLMQQKAGDTGQIIVTENEPEFKDLKNATQWSFKMEIPKGGFIGENDEFPFEAPVDGYQSVMKFNFQKDNPDWTTEITTNFYIKFGNPPLYGRIQVQTGISYGEAIFTYAINPSGSRNLEPVQAASSADSNIFWDVQ